MIHGVDIRSNITRFDGPLIDRRGRTSNSEHALFKYRAATYKTVQCGGNNLLGGKVFDKELQPGPNSCLRSQLLCELLGRISEFLYLRPVDSPQERLARRKV